LRESFFANKVFASRLGPVFLRKSAAHQPQFRKFPHPRHIPARRFSLEEPDYEQTVGICPLACRLPCAVEISRL